MNPTTLVLVSAMCAGLSASILSRLLSATRRRQQLRARQLTSDVCAALPASAYDALQQKLRNRMASRLAFVAATFCALIGAVAASRTVLSVVDSPWTATALIAATLLIAALLTTVIRDARVSAILTVGSAARHAVAQSLTRVAVEHSCIHHDVHVDSQHWVDHVLLNVNGIFAIYVVTPPAGKTGDLNVSFEQVSKRTKQLQHRISKPLGRVIPVRSVIVAAGCTINQRSNAEILVVAQNDLVMIQGWRDPRVALMSEDVAAIDRHLSSDAEPGKRSSINIRENAVLEVAL